MKPSRTRLGIVALEDRALLTTFGIPWADPGHVTLSFVADGTVTPYGPSNQAQTMGAAVSTDVWQREVLRAFQTWATYANINIGVVADGGQSMDTVGAVQGDTRFGDVRIAAAPMASTLLASAAPFSWSGTTLSGDITFNTNYPFGVGQGTSYDIYSVALHEAGHVLGLDHSNAAGSAMNEMYSHHSGLSTSDITNIRAIYGARTGDPSEGSAGNNTLATATTLQRESLLSNRFTALGDLTTSSDVDYFKFNVAALLGISGVAVRLQADGFSLLAPKITVYSSSGQVIASALSTDPLNNDLSIRFTPSLLGGNYFVKVEHSSQDVFGIGSYRLAADYLSVGSVLQPLGALLTPILDGNTNDILPLAQILSPLAKPAPDSRFDFVYRGVIENNADVDNYKIHAPTTPPSGSLNLDVLVWALDTGRLDPRVSIFNGSTGAPVAFQVLANDAGMMNIQIPNVSAHADYIVQVKTRTAGSHQTGGYFLGADFNQFALTNFDGVSSNTLDPAATDSATLTITEAAIYEFALSAQMLNSNGGGGVTMTVTDANGNVVLTLAVDAGKPMVTATRYLGLGDYSVTYAYHSVSGFTDGTLEYDLFLYEVTDGVGPYAPGGTKPGTTTSGGSTMSGGYTYAGSSTSKPSGTPYSF